VIKELNPVITPPTTLYTKDHPGIGICYSYQEFIEVFADSGDGIYISKVYNQYNAQNKLAPASLLTTYNASKIKIRF